jgi:hypothetical protein
MRLDHVEAVDITFTLVTQVRQQQRDWLYVAVGCEHFRGPRRRGVRGNQQHSRYSPVRKFGWLADWYVASCGVSSLQLYLLWMCMRGRAISTEFAAIAVQVLRPRTRLSINRMSTGCIYRHSTVSVTYQSECQLVLPSVPIRRGMKRHAAKLSTTAHVRHR